MRSSVDQPDPRFQNPNPLRNETDPIVVYATEMSMPVPALLRELERETHLKTLAPQMLSGPLQGRLLSLLSKLLQPKCILEIGTFTGYSALCLAEGLPEDGELHTIEANDELEYLIRKYFSRSEQRKQLHLHIGHAREIIPKLAGNFDLVFLDAGKRDYTKYYDLLIERIKPGGIILADNVLWSGKLIFEREDPDARLLHQFNEKLRQDDRVETVLLPIRDGLLVARKR